MSPPVRVLYAVTIRFPRVSGDEPHGSSLADAVNRFSPRERG